MKIKKIALSAFLVLASLALFTNCSQNSNAKADNKTAAKKDTTPKKSG